MSKLKSRVNEAFLIFPFLSFDKEDGAFGDVVEDFGEAHDLFERGNGGKGRRRRELWVRRKKRKKKKKKKPFPNLHYLY